MKLYGKLHHQEEMCILSAGSRQDYFSQSYGPLKFSIVHNSAILVRAISQQLITGIQLNFMGSFTTNRRCAYFQPVMVG